MASRTWPKDRLEKGNKNGQVNTENKGKKTGFHSTSRFVLQEFSAGLTYLARICALR